MIRTRILNVKGTTVLWKHSWRKQKRTAAFLRHRKPKDFGGFYCQERRARQPPEKDLRDRKLNQKFPSEFSWQRAHNDPNKRKDCSTLIPFLFHDKNFVLFTWRSNRGKIKKFNFVFASPVAASAVESVGKFNFTRSRTPSTSLQLSTSLFCEKVTLLLRSGRAGGYGRKSLLFRLSFESIVNISGLMRCARQFPR